VLQTVCRKLQEDSGTGGFDHLVWLEKPGNLIDPKVIKPAVTKHSVWSIRGWSTYSYLFDSCWCHVSVEVWPTGTESISCRLLYPRWLSEPKPATQFGVSFLSTRDDDSVNRFT
jgi:hypothetical protein